MTMPGVWVPLLANLDLPSFSGFPLAGLLLWAAFAALAAAGIAAALWMDRQNQELAIPNMEWWYLGIGATLAALLIGTMEGGMLTIPIVAVGLPALLAAFTRERDKRVPSARRLITRDGLKNLLQGFRDGRAQARVAAKEAAAKPVEPPKNPMKPSVFDTVPFPLISNVPLPE